MRARGRHGHGTFVRRLRSRLYPIHRVCILARATCQQCGNSESQDRQYERLDFDLHEHLPLKVDLTVERLDPWMNGIPGPEES